MATNRNYGTGRRKSSVARVYIMPGTGKITVNKRSIDEYFGLETLKTIVRQPLVATQNEGKLDVLVNVCGGGTTGQAGAIRHGLSRALCEMDSDFRPVLKRAGFLTRDSRMKERKKYGLKAARQLLAENMPKGIFPSRSYSSERDKKRPIQYMGLLKQLGSLFLSL